MESVQAGACRMRVADIVPHRGGDTRVQPVPPPTTSTGISRVGTKPFPPSAPPARDPAPCLRPTPSWIQILLIVIF